MDTMDNWALYNSYICYDQNCQLQYLDMYKYRCAKHLLNHVCGWSDCVTGECPKCPYGPKCYKGPKCPVVENEEGWLVCEMTGSVLDDQPRYDSMMTENPQESHDDEEVHIPSDKDLGSWLLRKSNEVTFQDVNVRLFEPLLADHIVSLQQRYMIYCCMSNLWRNNPYFTQFYHKHRYKITKGFMAACWDCFNGESRPLGMITHTYRKLNDLTRHLKMIIRAVIGCKQGHHLMSQESPKGIGYYLLTDE